MLLLSGAMPIFIQPEQACKKTVFLDNSGHTQCSERCACGDNSMNANVCRLATFLTLERLGLSRDRMFTC